jgi:uncharacterized protein (TIGR02246 family)
MKNLVFFVTTTLAVLATSHGVLAQSEKEDRSEDEKAIMERMGAVQKAVNARDVEAYVALYTRDADSISPTAEVVKGKRELRAALKKQFSEIPPQQKFQLTSQSVRFIGRNAAVQDIAISISGAAEGAPTKLHATVVLVKRQGKWLAACARFMAPYTPPADG